LQLNLDQTPLEYMASCFPDKKLDIEVPPALHCYALRFFCFASPFERMGVS
jgi:hypothetical protein